MLWLLEKGMILRKNSNWAVRIVGNLAVIPPTLFAKWIDRR